MRTQHNQDGITLLVTLLLMGVLMGVSATMLNITLKQYQLSGIVLASEIAFQAANAGVECALYWDDPENWGGSTDTSKFDVPGDGTARARLTGSNGISCMQNNLNTKSDDLLANAPTNDSDVAGGQEQLFRFNWGTDSGGVTPALCTEVSVYKFYSTATDVNIVVPGVSTETCLRNNKCTVIQSRGYNVPCTQILTSARVVEREFTYVSK